MEKHLPLVSICMPAYNAGKYIAAAINSIVEQSYKHWELIIVDDGSTDNTNLVLKTYRDHRIKIYKQENLGQCSAANKAFGLSKGVFVKFMDADDLISKDHISNQIATLDGRHDCIAYGSWGRFYNNDPATFKAETGTISSDMEPIEWLIRSMTKRQIMLQCALWMVPRQVLNRSGLWNEQLSLINDFEFFIRVLLCSSRLLYSDNAVLYYRSGVTGSLSGTKSREGALSAYNSINWGTQHLLNVENSPRVRKIAANCFQDLIYTLYPTNSEIIRSAEMKVTDLGGSDVRMQAGGYTRVLVNIVGWKMAKKIKHYFLNKDHK